MGLSRRRFTLVNPAEDLMLPTGAMQPVGYLIQQHSVRLDRPVQAYDRWIAQIPSTYREAVLNEPQTESLSFETDPDCLALLKHYRSLMLCATVRKSEKEALTLETQGLTVQ